MRARLGMHTQHHIVKQKITYYVQTDCTPKEYKCTVEVISLTSRKSREALAAIQLE
jgi:hypothetical protein